VFGNLHEVKIQFLDKACSIFVSSVASHGKGGTSCLADAACSKSAGDKDRKGCEDGKEEGDTHLCVYLEVKFRCDGGDGGKAVDDVQLLWNYMGS
jgi:hypothetical protein